MPEHVICNKEAAIASIQTDMASVKDDISDIKHAILGNGQPGIKTELAKQGQVISALIWITGVSIMAILGLAVDLFAKKMGVH